MMDDEPNYSSYVVIPWHMSEAKALLKQDIANGKNPQINPQALYEMRDEYQVYPLKNFWNHI